MLAQVVMILPCIQEVSVSNLGWRTNSPNRLLWFSSASPGKWWDYALNYTIPSSLLFTVFQQFSTILAKLLTAPLNKP
jgi:hypothetical protein